VNGNVNDRSGPDVIKKRAETLSEIRSVFASHPGAAYQFARRSGIPRSFITLYLQGERAGIRGKAKIWAQQIQREAKRLLAADTKTKQRNLPHQKGSN
jgi:hypothetical protein